MDFAHKWVLECDGRRTRVPLPNCSTKIQTPPLSCIYQSSISMRAARLCGWQFPFCGQRVQRKWPRSWCQNKVSFPIPAYQASPLLPPVAPLWSFPLLPHILPYDPCSHRMRLCLPCVSALVRAGGRVSFRSLDSPLWPCIIWQCTSSRALPQVQRHCRLQ